MSEAEVSSDGAVTVEQLDRMIAEFKEQGKKCEELQAVIGPENQKLARMEAQIASALKSLGRDNYATPNGTFYFIRKWRFNLPPEGEQRAAFIGWLKEKGIADKYLTVNSNSYNSLLNQERNAALRNGEILSIPGVPEPALFETVGFRER